MNLPPSDPAERESKRLLWELLTEGSVLRPEERRAEEGPRVWLTMSLCWWPEGGGRDGFPYEYAAVLSTRLWRIKTDLKVERDWSQVLP